MIFCPAILLKEFIKSKYFLANYVGSLKWKCGSSVNRASVTSSFPVCIPYLSPLCLIATAKMLHIVLNTRGKTGHPYPDFRANSLIFIPIWYNLAVGLLYIQYFLHT